MKDAHLISRRGTPPNRICHSNQIIRPEVRKNSVSTDGSKAHFNAGESRSIDQKIALATEKSISVKI